MLKIVDQRLKFKYDQIAFDGTFCIHLNLCIKKEGKEILYKSTTTMHASIQTNSKTIFVLYCH